MEGSSVMLSATDRMASDLNRTGPIERDTEQVIIISDSVNSSCTHSCSIVYTNYLAE